MTDPLPSPATNPETTNPPPASNEVGGANPSVFRHSPDITKLMEALVKAKAKMGAVPMSGENKFDKYVYSKLVDYLLVCDAPLVQFGIMPQFTTMERTRLEDRSTKGGAMEHCTEVKLCLRLTHVSGQWMEFEGYGEGQDRADKSLYKGTTGARKYLLGMALNLASGEGDPEGTEREPEEEMDVGELKTEITQLAIRDRLSDEAIVKCFNDLTGEFITQWRTQKVPTLNRIYRGWAKLVVQADKLGLRKPDNMTKVKTTQPHVPTDETGDEDDTPIC
jgi:hypothetical protein